VVRLVSSILVGVAAVALLPAPASASDDELRVGDVCFGLLMPYPDCSKTIHFDLGIAWQRSLNDADWQTYARGFIEAGLLFATERSESVHVGPVAELGFDLGQLETGWHLTPKLMGRLWIESFVTLEAAVGGTVAHTTLKDPGVASQLRVGAFASVAFTLHGLFGPFVATEQLFDPNAYSGLDHRFILGLRGTIGFWAAAAYALSGGK
jgi:hypothetical protein